MDQKNICIKRHFSIWPLKKRWESIEMRGGGVNVYQSYFVQEKIFENIYVYYLPRRKVAVYFEIIENNQTICIVPLCKSFGKNEWESLGHFNGVQSFDFIYSSSITKSEMERYIQALMDTLKAESLKLYNIPESSLVYQVLKKNPDVIVNRTNKNVNICFEESYSTYISGLSKSVRQNIRTAYNRMNTDGVNIQLEYYSGQKIPIARSNAVIDVYCDRHEIRYGLKTSKAKKFYLRYLDFSTRCQRYYSDNLLVILLMNGEIAGFLSGLIDRDASRAVIPRLSINDKYKRYSPGVVLINEVAKRFIETEKLNNLDLSKGDEGYKKSMGGVEYKTFDIFVMRELNT